MKRFGAIQLVIIAGFIHGLLYVFLSPPWQHHDEPGHFEVIWLIANRSGLPTPGEYDQGMRREVAASMLEHNFYTDLDIRPDLLAQANPIWIGITQTDSFSLYYWLVALPLRLVPTSDIVFQLYLCRIVSLLFYWITILAAHGAISEFVPMGNASRWLFPALLVLLPSFNNLMTSVNSDVGAVAFFSLFIWAGLRLICRGFSITGLFVACLLAAGCFFVKNTAALAVPLLIFPLVFSIFRKHRQPIAWAILFVVLFLGIFFFITSGDVAYWYQTATQITPTRTLTSQTSVGSYAFQLDTSSGSQHDNLIQLLPIKQVEQLRGKKVTFGYWIWANQPIAFHSPMIKSDTQEFSEPVDITLNPVFHAFTVKISENTRHILVVLDAPTREGQVIYIDGLVLVKGDLSLSGRPIIRDPEAREFTWGKKIYINPIRNASAEQVWPRPRTVVLRFLGKISPLQPNMVLASLADWGNSKWYYRASLEQLFRSFWGQFGWDHISLSRNIYIVLSLITLLGISGGVVRFLMNIRKIPWDIFTFLGIILIGIWGAALVRGIHSIAGTIFIPSARYAAPAIIPTAWVLWLGWTEWPKLINRWITIPAWVKIGIFFVFLISLDILSIVTIANFYKIF